MKKRPMKTCVGACLALAFVCMDAHASEVVTQADRAWARDALKQERAVEGTAASNTVGVLYFRNQTGQPSLDPLRKGLALMLITDLSSVEGLRVVERVRLQALVEELGLGRSGLVSPESAPRVGRLLGANWLVGGDLTAPGPEAAGVDSAVVDVPKSAAVATPSASGQLAEFFRVEKELLFGVLKVLKVELTPAQEKRLRRPCTQSTSALLALSRAVDASDEGNYKDAERYYEAAMREDPGVCLAREGVYELRKLRVVPPKVSGQQVLNETRSETSKTGGLASPDEVKPLRTSPTTKVRIDVSVP
ncbi:MAG: hypothetical protein HZB55_23675 [Deltaproteobacteria bacterium]|nr:hypothetical protein [Deltaproteobacteria bacterium]